MKTSRRAFISMVGTGSAAAALSGCDQAANVLTALAGLDEQRDLRPPTENEIDPVAHALPVDPDDARADLEVQLLCDAAGFDLCDADHGSSGGGEDSLGGEP